MNILNAHGNVFVTGAAGTGKSHLIRHYHSNKDRKEFPLLASTGAAAVLVGGRTFHSFFGLGIMQGGFDATVERALQEKRVVKRLSKIDGVIIDEVSMLSGTTIRAAETICRVARKKNLPWGGIKVVTVGDFAQLPPVTPFQCKRDWAFQDQAWKNSGFTPAILKTIMRTAEGDFLSVLNHVRDGRVSPEVKNFLDERTRATPERFDGTRFVPHRETAERYNLDRLKAIPAKEKEFPTIYSGHEKFLESLKHLAPVPEILKLKEDALVMLRQNDPTGRWVNGSLGHITKIKDDSLTITPLANGNEIEVEPTSFALLNAEGIEMAVARNFPVNLAYASTIHKSQGMTLDMVLMDLRGLWEPGQAYVALSRAKSAKGLFLLGWDPSSIQTDWAVQEYYRGLNTLTTPTSQACKNIAHQRE